MMRQMKDYITSPTGRLAVTYLAIIMSLTMLFSVIIYQLASSQLDRPPKPIARNIDREEVLLRVKDILDERAELARADMLAVLVLLNAGTLISGAVLSHLLARRTLLPIEMAMKAQTRFVTDASHELKTPLTSMLTTAEVAIRKKDPTKKHLRDALVVMHSDTIKLHNLTTALLDMSTEKKEHYRSIELYGLGERAKKRVDILAQEAGITIINRLPRERRSLPEKTAQKILGIYLENAIKYSSAGSKVRMYHEMSGELVTLCVEDGGEGIPQSDIDLVFDRFYRVDNSRSSQIVEGHGLGLSIAKRLAEANNVELSLESELKKGSIFKMRTKKEDT